MRVRKKDIITLDKTDQARAGAPDTTAADPSWELVSLTAIFDEIIRETPFKEKRENLKKRFQKLKRILQTTPDDFYTKGGKIYFLIEQKEFIKELIYAMEDGFLPSLGNAKKNRALASDLDEAKEFHQHMASFAEEIADPEVRQLCLNILERVTRISLQEARVHLIALVKEILYHTLRKPYDYFEWAPTYQALEEEILDLMEKLRQIAD